MRACQALSLDEQRTTFHPELWNEHGTCDRRRPTRQGAIIRTNSISQVWFAGVHSNVGGGYPDDALAYIPLVWMMTEAQRCGLRFKSDLPITAHPDRMIADPDTFKNAISRRDKDGRLYDPRKGLGGYYRYGPRKLVRTSIAELSILEEDEVVRRARQSPCQRVQAHRQPLACLCTGRPAEELRRRQDRDGGCDAGSIRLRNQADAAMRAEAQEHVWNEIWKRRMVYFATVGATPGC